MMYRLTEEQIEKAVNWWADRICMPTFSGLSPEERRDPRNDGYQLAEVLALSLVQHTTPEQREKFINALREALSAEDYNPYHPLSVDYHPCRVLADAAEVAGISTNNFPWKTVLRFERDGTVHAACGYASPFEQL